METKKDPCYDASRHHYAKQIEDLRRMGALRDGLIPKIYHDNGCSIFRGGYCDCNPDVVLVVSSVGGKKE